MLLANVAHRAERIGLCYRFHTPISSHAQPSGLVGSCLELVDTGVCRVEGLVHGDATVDLLEDDKRNGFMLGAD